MLEWCESLFSVMKFLSTKHLVAVMVIQWSVKNYPLFMLQLVLVFKFDAFFLAGRNLCVT